MEPSLDPRPDVASTAPGWEVVLACTSWTAAQRRGLCFSTDRLIAWMVAEPRVARLLVANPFRSGPVRHVRRLFGQGEPPLPEGPGVRVQVTPTRLRRHDPVPLPSLQRAYRGYDSQLRAASTAAGMRRPAVITSDPFIAAFSSLDWASAVTYYAFDDWATHPGHRRWWSVYPAAYQAIRARGHRVVAVSQVLLDRIGPAGDCRVVPNGIATDEWERPAAPPAWFASLPAPRMLYVGGLDQRLDVDAIREVAIRFATGTVVLVGEEIGPTVAPLRDVSNIRIVPPVGRSEVVALVHGADVCLIPHRRTALIEAMSPLKLFEYLAGGRPVAATDLPPVRSVDARTVLVPEGGRFSDGVVTALAQGPLREPERRAFVAANSWADRCETIASVALADAPDALDWSADR